MLAVINEKVKCKSTVSNTNNVEYIGIILTKEMQVLDLNYNIAVRN